MKRPACPINFGTNDRVRAMMDQYGSELIAYGRWLAKNAKEAHTRQEMAEQGEPTSKEQRNEHLSNIDIYRRLNKQG